mgnify:CR=1 FL=1
MHPSDNELQNLTESILNFRDQREWKQFHKPKDVAISLVLEASELLEHFQWKTDEQIAAYVKSNQEGIGQELADVLYWVLLLSHDLGIDLASAARSKLELNARKYPVEKARGSAKKYTEL